MARDTKREQLLERQNTSQTELFDGDGLPACPAVLESIVHRRYEHTGVRLLEDDTKALRLVELLVCGWGVKRIAREMSISPKTVRAARRVLVGQGKMAPYVERVTQAMEDAIEAGVTVYRDALEEGKIPAAQIPVGVAIMFDKRALARGEPTSISAAMKAQDRDLSAEAINRVFESMPVCNSDAVLGHEDSESSQKLLERPKTGGKPRKDATLDATSGPEPAVPAPSPNPPASPSPAIEPMAPTDPSPDHAAESNGGGGGGPTPPVTA